MTTAIDWIKDRTHTEADEPLVVDGVTYSVVREIFAGHLPRPMIRAAAKAKLEQSDLVNEGIRVNLKSGYVEYMRTVYTPVAA